MSHNYYGAWCGFYLASVNSLTPCPHLRVLHVPPGPPCTPPAPEEPIQVGRTPLTPKEHQCRFNQRLCIYCGQPGHHNNKANFWTLNISTCPALPKGLAPQWIRSHWWAKQPPLPALELVSSSRHLSSGHVSRYQYMFLWTPGQMIVSLTLALFNNLKFP